MFLVTGATGFLGSHLVCHLLQAGHAIKALKRSSSRMDEFDYISSLYMADNPKLLEQMQWVVGDVEDVFSLEEALEGVSSVFHAAALVSFHSKDAIRLIETNQKGTANLVNTCIHKGIKYFFHISSNATMGSTPWGEKADENTEWKLNKKTTQYSLSKYLAEMEVWRAAEEGLKICIINPSIILGAGIWKRGTCRLFYNVYHNFPFYSVGSSAFVDVKDVCRAILFLHDKGITDQRYLIHGHNLSFKELFTQMAKALDRRPPYVKITANSVGIAWRFFKLVEWITGKRGLITKESAQSSVKKQLFSSDKLLNLGFELTPIEETIAYTTTELKKKAAPNK
jgi:dihydroflavonol-4-reductase